jgi:hypothetical protein
VGGDVGIGEHANREQAGRLGDRQRAVEIARVFLSATAEVEDQALTDDLCAHAHREVAIGGLQNVLRVQLAVRERRQARPCAPLGVVEHRVGRLAQALHAEPARELSQPQCSSVVGGQLGAQVGAALAGLAHLPRELLDRLLVEHTR